MRQNDLVSSTTPEHLVERGSTPIFPIGDEHPRRRLEHVRKERAKGGEPWEGGREREGQVAAEALEGLETGRNPKQGSVCAKGGHDILRKLSDHTDEVLDGASTKKEHRKPEPELLVGQAAADGRGHELAEGVVEGLRQGT